MSASDRKSETYTQDFFPHDSNRSVLLKDTVTDNAVTAIINLGAELWATRRRLSVIEQLLYEGTRITPEAIEQYMPTKEVAQRWEEERDTFISRIYDVLARVGDIPANAKMNYSGEKRKGN